MGDELILKALMPTEEDFIILKPFQLLRKMMTAIRGMKHLFNRLTINNDCSGRFLCKYLCEGLRDLSVNLVRFSEFSQSPAIKAGEHTFVANLVSGVFDSHELFTKMCAEKLGSDTDPREILRFEEDDEDNNLDYVYRELLGMFMIFYHTEHFKFPVNVYFKLYKNYLYTFETILNKAGNALGCNTEMIDIYNPFTKEHDSVMGLPGLEFTMHDSVMHLTADEQKEKAEAEEAKREAEKREEELNAFRSSVKSEAEIILKAYNKQRELGNLVKFELTDNAVRILNQQNTPEECKQVEALYTFLMAMSCTSRYMPGEEGEPFDRIMGSFMELENDVMTYDSMFQIYLGPGGFGINHSMIAAVLPLFSTKNGRIVAQYVDTRDYIDAPDPEMDQRVIGRTAQIFRT